MNKNEKTRTTEDIDAIIERVGLLSLSGSINSLEHVIPMLEIFIENWTKTSTKENLEWFALDLVRLERFRESEHYFALALAAAPASVTVLNGTDVQVLSPSNTGAFDYFGYSVSISGDIALIGAVVDLSLRHI